MNKPVVIHWFRKGLRLHDNPALLSALEKVGESHYELRPVFILDPWFVKNARVGPNRWRFLIQSLQDLDNNLKKIGSRLFVVKGSPLEVFKKLLKEWNVKKLTFEVDIEPYAKSRDEEIKQLAEKHSVTVITKVSHTIYDLEQVFKANGNKAPLTYVKFQSVVAKFGIPQKAFDSPGSLPKQCQTLLLSEDYNVPHLEEMRVDLTGLGKELFRGGESEALIRLNKYMNQQEWVCKFSKPDTSPNSMEPSTTVLSPYLKFGCLSPRLMYHRIHDVVAGRKHTSPPTSLTGQLLWREFYYTCGAYVPNFDRMEGNPICKQIPWKRDREDKNYLAWKDGQTGYPFIDAIMTQLRTEGWIHHLARHAVACFLTRGDLWVSWELGQEVFEELLLDADWSLNAGNWMWLSASAFFHQYFRVYSPIAFGKKTDKNGDYIKRYLPVLKKFPSEYIYEPWKAPLSVQQKAGCIIGKDYPKRIVDHEIAVKENLAKMKEAYQGHKEEGSENVTAKRKKAPSKDSPPKITKFLKKK
ncbi:cryptochrome-2-like isoform X1 [Daphnia carinata]|uniref:cryptochrome-2-like isoform X1 n=1 Tax=Daphnia carinata TaxID=120202 RepID=UPI00257946B0|nr:cryptochrome-2-like isoform X1 [Daphnia carinata]